MEFMPVDRDVDPEVHEMQIVLATFVVVSATTYALFSIYSYTDNRMRGHIHNQQVTPERD